MIDNISLKQQNLFISPILLKILDLSSPRSSMTLALYMPQSAVNLAAQSLPGNKWGTHSGVRLAETWSKLSLRMFRADWEVAVQNQRDVLSWQTLVTVPGMSSWVGREGENKASAAPYTQNYSNFSCQANKSLPRILNLTAHLLHVGLPHQVPCKDGQDNHFSVQITFPPPNLTFLLL